MTVRRGPVVLGVGTVALDSVETPLGSVEGVPGGSALYFGVAARLFCRVALVGVVGEDFPQEALRTLEGLGVDLAGVERRPGESFRWKVRYGADLTGRQTLETNRGVTLHVSPTVPPALRRPAAVFLGSTDPGVQKAVLDQIDDGAVVVLDTMSHWIRDRRAELEEILGGVDVLLVNEEEAALLSGESALPPAAALLREMGPAWVVIKRGARGASAFGPSAEISVPARSVPTPVDPTGAGDAFAGGLVGTLAGSERLAAPSMSAAMEAGAAMGALAVSSFSLDALIAADFPALSPL